MKEKFRVQSTECRMKNEESGMGVPPMVRVPTHADSTSPSHDMGRR
jgi:hypothetical protein